MFKLTLASLARSQVSPNLRNRFHSRRDLLRKLDYPPAAHQPGSDLQSHSQQHCWPRRRPPDPLALPQQLHMDLLPPPRHHLNPSLVAPLGNVRLLSPPLLPLRRRLHFWDRSHRRHQHREALPRLPTQPNQRRSRLPRRKRWSRRSSLERRPRHRPAEQHHDVVHVHQRPRAHDERR